MTDTNDAVTMDGNKGKYDTMMDSLAAAASRAAGRFDVEGMTDMVNYRRVSFGREPGPDGKKSLEAEYITGEPGMYDTAGMRTYVDAVVAAALQDFRSALYCGEFDRDPEICGEYRSAAVGIECRFDRYGVQLSYSPISVFAEYDI